MVDQTNPVTQTDAVRVRHDGRFSKDISHNQVGTFTPDTRQL